jgi:very-short-patch-repair endonuclease
MLRDRRFEGVKFRRQVPFGPYVLDFACIGLGIAIEADGPFHDPAKDAMRDAWLAERGLRVLRFTNEELLAKDGRALRRIMDVVRLAANPSSVPLRGPPSPRGEGRAEPRRFNG